MKSKLFYLFLFSFSFFLCLGNQTVIFFSLEVVFLLRGQPHVGPTLLHDESERLLFGAFDYLMNLCPKRITKSNSINKADQTKPNFYLGKEDLSSQNSFPLLTADHNQSKPNHIIWTFLAFSSEED